MVFCRLDFTFKNIIVTLCVEETLEKPRSLLEIPKDFSMLIYKNCCMTRKQRRQHPSIIQPATSIYIDDNEQQQMTILEHRWRLATHG